MYTARIERITEHGTTLSFVGTVIPMEMRPGYVYCLEDATIYSVFATRMLSLIII